MNRFLKFLGKTSSLLKNNYEYSGFVLVIVKALIDWCNKFLEAMRLKKSQDTPNKHNSSTEKHTYRYNQKKIDIFGKEFFSYMSEKYRDITNNKDSRKLNSSQHSDSYETKDRNYKAKNLSNHKQGNYKHVQNKKTVSQKERKRQKSASRKRKRKNPRKKH